MYQSQAKRRGLFGSQQPPITTPPIFNSRQAQMDYAPAPMQPQAEQAKPGLGTRLFGKGWEDKAFAIGGMMQGDGGRAASMIDDRQQQAAMIAEKQRQASMSRENDWQDWLRKEEYQRANPKPVNNDSVNDYEFYQKTLSPAEFESWKKNNILEPAKWVTGPDGRPYQVGGGGAAPQVIKGDLPQGWVVDGGPTQPASGSFRQ